MLTVARFVPVVVAAVGAMACARSVYTDPQERVAAERGPTRSEPRPDVEALSGRWDRCGELGSGGPVHLALSADGGTLAVAHANGVVTVHRTDDLSVSRRLAGKPGAELALSADGARLAITSGDGVAIWRLAEQGPPFERAGAARSPVFSPDGETLLLLLAGGSSLMAEVWSLAGTVLLRAGSADVARFAQGGRQVVVFDERQVSLFEAAGKVSSFSVPIDLGVTISPRGDRIVGQQSTQGPPGQGPSAPSVPVEAYQIPGGGKLWQSSIAFPQGTTMAFSEDQRLLVSAAGSELWRIDATTGAATSYRRFLTDELIGVAVAPVTDDLIYGTRGGVVRWPSRVQGQGQVDVFPTLPGTGHTLRAIRASPDGRWLATVASSTGVLLWDLPARSVVSTSPVSRNGQSVAFSPDSQRVLATYSSLIEERSVTAPHGRTWALDVRAHHVSEARYAPDARHVAFSSPQGVTLLRIDDNTTLATAAAGIPWAGHDFSPDGRFLAVSGPELWRVSDRSRVWPSLPRTTERTTPPGAVPEHSVAFSPDGSLVLDCDFTYLDGLRSPLERRGMGPYSNIARLYRASDGSLVRTLGDVRSWPAFSADGRWIVAGGQVFAVDSSEVVSLFEGGTLSTFAPDGTIAAETRPGIVTLFCPQP